MNNAKSALKIRTSLRGNLLREDVFTVFPIVFGRGQQCHLSLVNFDFLSRSHGAISFEHGRIRVTDLNSKNGLTFQGERLTDFELASGQEFQVGEMTIKVEKAISRNSEGDTVGIEVGLHSAKVGDRNVISQAQVGSLEKEKSKRVELPTIPKTTQEGVYDDEHSGFYKLENNVRTFELLPDPEVLNCRKEDICLQGIIVWGQDIYDVRNFVLGDRLLIGPNPFEPIYLPTLSAELDLGRFSAQGAQINLPSSVEWSLSRNGVSVSQEKAVEAGELKISKSQLQFQLSLSEVLLVYLDHDLKLYLRYVPIPRPLVKKTLLENREEFKIAISVSLLIHVAFSIVSLFSAPKEEPSRVENVPDRFARLLVEPPKQMLAAPPLPTPIATPTPTPIPQIAKMEPPKPTPAPPKPVEKPKPKPTPQAKPKPEPKPAPEVHEAKSEPRQITKTPVAKTEKLNPPSAVPAKEITQAPPSKEQIAAAAEASKAAAEAALQAQQEQEMLNALSGLQGPTKVANQDANLKVSKTGTVSANTGVKVSGLVGQLKSENSGSGLGASNLNGPSLGASVGKSGYVQAGSGTAGQKGVQGKVVGSPLFKGSTSNGLTQDQVMSVVNQHLSEVHRCYERALFEDNSLNGRIEYEWEINADGTVKSAQVKRNEMEKSDSLNNCVLALFKKMKFPRSANGMTTLGTIGFPFGREK